MAASASSPAVSYTHLHCLTAARAAIALAPQGCASLGQALVLHAADAEALQGILRHGDGQVGDSR